MSKLRRAVLSVIGLLLAIGLASCETGPEPRPVYVPPPPAVEPSSVAPPSSEARGSGEGQPVLVGTVLSVTDGDTIKVQLSSGPIDVRFHSIDAPEKSQPWGREAYAALYQRLNRQVVSLDVATQDRYGRLVAIVYLGDENINAWMVQQGNAWAYRHYLSDQDYCRWEDSARAVHLGLWGMPASNWYAPWEWRRVQHGDAGGFTDYSHETAEHCIGSIHRSGRAADETVFLPSTPSSEAPTGQCRIKGNISDSGRIYHVPGSPFYDRTRIDESKGERWFCTEAEARAAGWRPPKN